MLIVVFGHMDGRRGDKDFPVDAISDLVREFEQTAGRAITD